MSDIKLFRQTGDKLVELSGSTAPLEKSLQSLFEQNLEALLGVRFIASEYITTHGGRMDTLGIDENGYPVIIEYKRNHSENVINQGLFYLDWLMDHRGDFELLVRNQFDNATADLIEWSAPRLICIAADFNKYDAHAVKQMSRNIELIRYRHFGNELLMLDLLTAVSTKPIAINGSSDSHGKQVKYKTNAEFLADASVDLAHLYADIEAFMLGLGDDVIRKELRFYFAFKRIKNFACAEIRPQVGAVRLYLKIDPATVSLDDGFARDVRQIGHYGTGDLELTVRTPQDFERAKPLIIQSYEAS